MEFTAKQIAEFIGGKIEGNELASQRLKKAGMEPYPLSPTLNISIISTKLSQALSLSTRMLS